MGNFSQESLFNDRLTKHQNLSLAASAADRGTAKAERPGAGTISSFVFKHHSPCILGYLGCSVVGELLGTLRLFVSTHFPSLQSPGVLIMAGTLFMVVKEVGQLSALQLGAVCWLHSLHMLRAARWTLHAAHVARGAHGAHAAHAQGARGA